MKKYLLILLASIQLILQAGEPSLVILKTMSEALSDPAYKRWHESLIDCDKIDPGFPKHVLLFVEVPKKNVVISRKRLAQHGQDFQIINESLFVNTGDLLHALCAKGFLPGEEVTIRVATEDGSYKQECTLIPYPIISKSKDAQLVIHVRLTRLPPHACYELIPSGFAEGESINFCSDAGGELRFWRPCSYEEFITMGNNSTGFAYHDPKNPKNLLMSRFSSKVAQRAIAEPSLMNFKEGVSVSYTPNKWGKNGGEAKVIFSDNQGRQVELQLPWGNDLVEFFKGSKRL